MFGLPFIVIILVAAMGAVATGCGDDDSDTGGQAAQSGSDSGPPQGSEVKKIAAFGVNSPETNNWDKGGDGALRKAADLLGAQPTWLSNIAFDQSPQVFERLVRDDFDVMVGHGSGFADAALDAAQKHPDRWFWVFSDLASTKGLPNVVGIKLGWSEVGYLAGATACMASKTKKIGVVLAQPIPAYAHAAGGLYDGVKDTCGSEDNVLATWTGTFDDNAKTKQAAEALIAQGADVVTDFQDAATPGVQAAVKGHPEVLYVGTKDDWTEEVPDQVITSIYFNYDAGYLDAAGLLKDGKLEPKIYTSGVQTEGVKLTQFQNTTPKVEEQARALFDKIKSGEVKVNPNRSVTK
jgi:basic membrane protein A